MLYLSLREVFIRNIAGSHDQIIPAGTPTFVCPPLHKAANASGCVPCDEKGNVLQPGAPVPSPKVSAPSPEPEVTGYTIEDVKSVVEQLIATNNKTDFNATTGKPKVAPVAKLLGHKPSVEEIDQAWDLVEAG